MKKINIVKDTKDFEEAIHKGTLYKNKHYIIYILNNDREYCRFGISVGKKISNKAVVRNKLKRQIKSIIDNNKNIYQKNKDYIIILKRSVLESNYKDLELSFIDLIKKIK